MWLAWIVDMRIGDSRELKVKGMKMSNKTLIRVGVLDSKREREREGDAAKLFKFVKTNHLICYIDLH